MQKPITLLLALAMLLSLCACGSSSGAVTSNDTTLQNDEEINEVLYEDDSITLTLLKKYDESTEIYGSVGYVMLAENKVDEEIAFGFQDTSVNDFVINAIISTGSSVGSTYSIEANKKVVFNLKINIDEVIKSADDLINFQTTFNVYQITKESGNSQYMQSINNKTIQIP